MEKSNNDKSKDKNIVWSEILNQVTDTYRDANASDKLFRMGDDC